MNVCMNNTQFSGMTVQGIFLNQLHWSNIPSADLGVHGDKLPVMECQVITETPYQGNKISTSTIFMSRSDRCILITLASASGRRHRRIFTMLVNSVQDALFRVLILD